MLNDDQIWIFKKHTNNIQLLIDVALHLKSNKSSVSKKDKNEMYDIFSESELYNPRKSLRDKPLDAINHKLDGLSYFMFGYSDRINDENKFIFSPLGNLFLKYLHDKNKLSKIFSCMLISMQFPHPYSKPSEYFLLYPFRLIFKLLLDKRLQGRLYHYEVYKIIIHTISIDEKKYEFLVKSILNSRKKSWNEKLNELSEIQHKVVKSVYEWQYYIVPLLGSLHIFKINSGDIEQKLYHPQKDGSKSPPTARKANNGYVEINDNLTNFIDKLLNKYSFLDIPILLSDSQRKSNDVTKEIYSFYPELLLAEIGEKISFESHILNIPKLVTEYSKNPDNSTSGKFEKILEEAFNLFIDVEAQWLAGAGRTDIECMYLPINEKFSIEAKSTKNKLSMINAGRLKRHRTLISANYTIVITPRYVPSVRYDIEAQNIVLITADTLAEYLYNNIISNNRDISYADIQAIIVANLGKDISTQISNLTLSKFG